MILCLETATNICSVALCNNAGVISLKESEDIKTHSSLLTVFINGILKQNDLKASDLEAVAVSKGPGSYTGLRIGVSVSKGITYAASIPLIGVETTLAMFRGILDEDRNIRIDRDTLFCPMLDARRMEVYYSIFDYTGNLVKEISAEIIDKDSFAEIPDSKNIIFFGDGAKKCSDVINRPNSFFVPDFKNSAAHLFKPAINALKNRHFEDVAYFEPLYLKDFITSKPGKNVLGN
jgi:tRNA threonylcarbamoyladenosine biosynthesis protein TsaB